MHSGLFDENCNWIQPVKLDILEQIGQNGKGDLKIRCEKFQIIYFLRHECFIFADEGEDGDSDLHQCGCCKEMFTNLTLYISHKIERPCRTGPAGKSHQWNNEEMEAEDEEKERGISNKESKVRGKPFTIKCE